LRAGRGSDEDAGPSRPEEEPDVRFSLANERTVLAWIRTALALVAAGVIAARYLDEGQPWPLVVGLVLVLLGGGIGWVSYDRWRANQVAMRQGRPLPNSPLPRVLTLGLALGSIAAAILLVAQEV
jgi:putative membrane protein